MVLSFEYCICGHEDRTCQLFFLSDILIYDSWFVFVYCWFFLSMLFFQMQDRHFKKYITNLMWHVILLLINHSILLDVMKDLQGCRYHLHMLQFGLLQTKIPFSSGSFPFELNSAFDTCLSRLGGCFNAKTTFELLKAVLSRWSWTF